MGLTIRISAVFWTGLFTLPALAQQNTDKSPNTVRISGTVIDDCGDEVRYANVQLLPAGSETPLATTRADDEGTFIFVGRPPTNYDLQAAAPGYKPGAATANASQGDVSVTVRVEGALLCPGGRRLKYIHSPLPQSLDTHQEEVYGDGPDQLSIFPRVTVCDIARNPERFNGKIVTVVRGVIDIDFEQFELSTKDCGDGMAGSIWLQYGRGPKSQPTRWCCGYLTPIDSPSVVQNSAFKLFDRYITARRKHCRSSGCNLYRVTATLTGRLDAVPTVLCPDGKYRCPEKGGYGHLANRQFA